MATIHWIGTGLSSIPGLRRLIADGRNVVVWNRTLETARKAVGDVATDLRAFTIEDLEAVVRPGDVIVSMLPADWHLPLARIALEKVAHFVSSSYISPEMRALDATAQAVGVALVNEVGLDPGIDHLMAHDLVARYKASDALDEANEISFLSYCGGVPAVPNDFRYKFSWSPLGVLKALRSPSRSIRDFEELAAERPWHALGRYEAPLPEPEAFEVYPNRDSLPFMAEYGFGPDWRVRDFVRGTLRLEGWAEAWADVFSEIEGLGGTEGDTRLTEMSRDFWARHAYAEGEPDRVVLCVSLKAVRDGAKVFHQTWVLDAQGDERGSAMGRLVSQTVAQAVEAVLGLRIPPGVSGAPSNPTLVIDWLDRVRREAQHLALVDHLA